MWELAIPLRVEDVEIESLKGVDLSMVVDGAISTMDKQKKRNAFYLKLFLIALGLCLWMVSPGITQDSAPEEALLGAAVENSEPASIAAPRSGEYFADVVVRITEQDAQDFGLPIEALAERWTERIAQNIDRPPVAIDVAQQLNGNENNHSQSVSK
ncbi:MAG: hypothetical protein AAFN40_26605 [Cyanobacteria bacterium J06560_6]